MPRAPRRSHPPTGAQSSDAASEARKAKWRRRGYKVAFWVALGAGGSIVRHMGRRPSNPYTAYLPSGESVPAGVKSIAEGFGAATALILIFVVMRLLVRGPPR